jgi:hypothetical protein
LSTSLDAFLYYVAPLLETDVAQPLSLGSLEQSTLHSARHVSDGSNDRRISAWECLAKLSKNWCCKRLMLLLMGRGWVEGNFSNLIFNAAACMVFDGAACIIFDGTNCMIFKLWLDLGLFDLGIVSSSVDDDGLFD